MGHNKHISAKRMPIRKGWLREISIAQKCTRFIEIPSWSQGGWHSQCLVHSSYSTWAALQGTGMSPAVAGICLQPRRLFTAPCLLTKLRHWPELFKQLKIQNCFLNKIYDFFFFKKHDFSLQLVQNSFDNKIMLFYIPLNSFSWLK